MSPEHNDFLLRALPPLVLLQADVTVVLPWVQPPGDGRTQVCQGPVEVMVQQTGGGFQQSLQQKRQQQSMSRPEIVSVGVLLLFELFGIVYLLK